MEITKVKPVWVKITDAAKMLGTSRYSIKKWIGAGFLEQAGVGVKLHYVTAASLERFLSANGGKGV